MDGENTQVHVSNRAHATREDKPGSGRGTGGKSGKIKNKHLVAAVVTVVVLALVTFGLFNVYRTTTGAQIDSSKYQAVFFTNGQVYFGNLTNLNSSYMRLTDVFYLQTQESENRDSANPQETGNQTDLQLIKLGSEIHGPEDEMLINKDQVLFFENLKSEGRVTQSIVEYYGSQNRQ